MATCPHCGRDVKEGAGFARHTRVCALRPSRDELKALASQRGMGWREMERRLGVSVPIVRRWLLEEGIEFGGKGKRGSEGNGDLVFELAPLFRQYHRCEACPGLMECRARAAAGLWMLCEMPSLSEVEQRGWLVLVLFWFKVASLHPLPLRSGDQGVASGKCRVTRREGLQC
jgi:hypothetical protein